MDWKAYDVGDAEIKALSGDLAPGAAQDDSKASRKGEDGLKIATGGNQLGALQVEVAATLDPAAEAAKKRLADEEARRKREQNALPDWHLRSTVSDETTSLGLAEERRRKVLDGEYALMDAEKAKGETNGAGADGKDATAEYYASMQWGQDDEDEDDEDGDDAEAFEEVAAAGGSVPVPAKPAQTENAKKRPAEEDADSGNVNGDGIASKKARAEEARPASATASASLPEHAEANGDQVDEDEEEEFEEV